MPLPVAVGSKHVRVKSLQDINWKMSKSDRNQKGVIYLTDDQGTIRQKVSKAVTDSKGGVQFKEDRPELANLLKIYATLKNIDEKIVDTYF